MGKRMKLPFFSRTTDSTSPWPWPAYCQQPKTLSFRDIDNGTFFKTPPTTYSLEYDETPEPNSGLNSELEGIDPVETVIKGLRSERLFFEPEETSSILEEAYSKGGARESILPFKESVALSVESQDPYLDFKKSMEEMVEAHGLKDSLEELQELLCCYLRMNGKKNHGYILGAFVDLLVGFAFASTNLSSSSSSTTTSSSSRECPCSCSRSPSSPLSFYTSSSSSCSASSSSYECSSSSNIYASSSVLEDEENDTSPCLSSLEAENEMERH